MRSRWVKHAVAEDNARAKMNIQAKAKAQTEAAPQANSADYTTSIKWEPLVNIDKLSRNNDGGDKDWMPPGPSLSNPPSPSLSNNEEWIPPTQNIHIEQDDNILMEGQHNVWHREK